MNAVVPLGGDSCKASVEVHVQVGVYTVIACGYGDITCVDDDVIV